MFKELDPHKAQEMVAEGSANVVDIRDPGSYSAGHIPNAISLNDENVKAYIESADKEKPLIVCCYHGNSSRGAAEYLAQNGFKEVYSMTGGFEAWPRSQE
jgi:thiosulfate sulfurtransferase